MGISHSSDWVATGLKFNGVQSHPVSADGMQMKLVLGGCNIGNNWYSCLHMENKVPRASGNCLELGLECVG